RPQGIDVDVAELVAEGARRLDGHRMAVDRLRIDVEGGVVMPAINSQPGQRRPAFVPVELHELEQALELGALATENSLRSHPQRRYALEPLRQLEPQQIHLRPPEQALLVWAELGPQFRVLRLKHVWISRAERRESRVG